MTQRKRREPETTDQRRERHRIELERESPETRERRLAADRERKRLMWLNATPEQKEAIRERDRERYRNGGAAKRRERRRDTEAVKRRAEAKALRKFDNAMAALEAREARAQATAEKRIRAAENTEFAYRRERSMRGAKKRGLAFGISIQDLRDQMDKQGRRCAYTGEFLPNTDWSVDRVDSAEGYVPGNIVLCTKWANVAKWMLSASDFIAACRRVVEYADNSTLKPGTVTDGNRQDPPT